MSDVHGHLKQIEEHWPIVAAIGAALSGMLATFIGWRKMKILRRQEDAERLRRLESAIGADVLRGDDSLVTVSVMENCKDALVVALDKHADNESMKYDELHSAVNKSHSRIDEIYNLLLEKKA